MYKNLIIIYVMNSYKVRAEINAHKLAVKIGTSTAM